MKFAAQIVETSGAVEGTTLELARIGRGGELSALLIGARHDRHVSFTKVYDAASQLGLVPIAYTGLSDAELAVVQGEWRLASREPLQGGFRMRRVSSNPVFTLKAARDRTARKWLSDEELRARQEAIRQRRTWVEMKRRRRPKP